MISAQTILVTGATAGFGKAITERLIKEGHRVIATGRRTERLVALHQLYGNALLPLTLDMNNHAVIRTLPDSLPKGWHEIDVLINNAGLALGIEPAYNASPDDWETMISTNASGLVEITRTFLPHMVARNHGYIISIGSIAGTYPYQGGNVYGATKAFVSQFMRNLRTDLLGTKIRVTNIEPGLCGGSEFSNIRLRDDAKAAAIYEKTKPLLPQDIAKTISWLLQLPVHMNVNHMEIMPVCQAPAGLSVIRED